jgi:hypothetical protein
VLSLPFTRLLKALWNTSALEVGFTALLDFDCFAVHIIDYGKASTQLKEVADHCADLVYVFPGFLDFELKLILELTRCNINLRSWVPFHPLSGLLFFFFLPPLKPLPLNLK